MKFLVVILLSLLGLSQSPKPQPIVPAGLESQHAATHRIEMEDTVDDARCSATAVGPHTLLTAGHCFVPSHSILIDHDKVEIKQIEYDENDHMLLVVNETFPAFLPIDERDLLPNEQVHMWGWPGRSETDVYRVGSLLKVETDDDGKQLQWFLMPCMPGDSGAGIIDEHGKVIAVVSSGDRSAHTGSFSLNFNVAQLAIIK